MIDYFAVLGVERRPAITEESLKTAYFRRSESLRPDRAEASDFSSVNAAFRTLVNRATRIQHLLKLEFGDAGARQIGSDLGELFGRIVKVLQRVDQELGSLSAQSSALLRALAFERMDALRDGLEQAEKELSERESDLLSQLDSLDQIWFESKARCREPLAAIALDLTFVQKWLNQVRERKIRLEELA